MTDMTTPEQPATAGFFAPVVGYKGGKGGGGSARTPIEDPDSLHGKAYARIIDLLGEGEIYGPAHGGDGLHDVMLNGTRVKDSQGNVSIPGVSVDFRTGTPFQEPLAGFPASENTIGIGIDLKAATPWVREFTNTALSAVRLNLATTQYEVKANGDRIGYRIEYAIDVSTDGGAYQTVFSGAFDGKTTSKYPRSHRIELPAADTNWLVRVRRITPDATTDLITDSTVIDSVVEIVDAKLRYPMSALAGLIVDAAQFNAVPTRAYHLKLRIVRVPANYNPEARTYAGAWDGTFKLAWTNNPAWCFFDLVSNDRYGLGDEVPAGLIDKWSLYQIGQYCDESVPDGFGGQEPRFTCNVYMQQAADAYRVVQDMASCFRGMAYALSGSVVPVADIPSDPRDWYTFTNSNVIDGKFTYGGTSRRSRATVALVSWTDLSDMGRQKVEVVEDRDAIARFGLRQTETTAFACSSRGQAHRIGKWLLLTAQVETRTVSFQTGLERARVMPGKIIRVADQHLMGRRVGGRIRSATASEITLDIRAGISAGDKLVVNLPSGLTEERTIIGGRGQYLTADMTIITVDLSEITLDMTTRPGGWLVIQVSPAFSEVPLAEAQWAVESPELSYQTFRVLSVINKGAMIAEVTAVQHTPSKYAAIDYDTKLETKPITAIPPSVQPPPTNVRLGSYSVIDQGIASHNATIAWDASPGAVAYEVEWRRDQSDWIPAGRTGGTSLDIRGIYTGAYLARVRAINGLDISSYWALSIETDLQGNVGSPPEVTHLTTASLVMAIQINWGFPAGPSIVGRTEIWYSATPNRGDAIKLGDFAHPQNTHTMMGLASGVQFYFWARLVDRTGLPGDFYPEGAGVLGESSANASIILDYLLGKITATQLSQTLLERIQTGEASAVEVESILNSLSAMYTIKTQLTVDGRTVLAGLGVGVENNEGILESQVLVFADRFAVLHPNGSGLILPFVIQDGQVIINNAIIGTATITEAMIVDAAITRAKIRAAAIGEAEIEDAAIKRAKIGVAEVDYLRIAGQSATVWAQFSHAGIYVDKEQADYQLFGFYTYSMPDSSDALVEINAWQDMGSVNFSYSKAYTYRVKHEQSGRTYEGIPSASQPRTFGVNSGQCVTLAFPGLPAGDQTFTVFVKPVQAVWAGGIPGQSDPNALNPENPGQVSNAYSTNARFQMSILSRMR